MRRGLMCLAILGVACSDAPDPIPPSQRQLADAPETPTTEVSDSAGVRIILNRGPGHMERDGPLELEEVMHIGGLNAPEPAQFYRVDDVKLHADGRVFVANEQDATIRVFEEDGTYIQRFGGLGEGPGEMGELDGVFFLGDSIVVFDDDGPGEPILFSAEGEYLRSFWNLRGDGFRSEMVAVGPQGWLAEVDYWDWDDDDDDEEAPVRVQREELYRVHPESDSIGDLLYVFPEEYEYRTEDWYEDPLWEPEFGSGLDRRGHFFIGQSFPYRIHEYGPNGELLAIIEREVPLTPVSESDVDVIRDEIRTYFDTLTEEGWDRADRIEETREEIEDIDRSASVPLPEYQPITGEILVSDDGWFWVERLDDLPPGVKEFERDVGEDRAERRPTYWDIFDSEGRYQGEVELPPRFEPMGVRGLDVAGVWFDDYDLEHVFVYRVVAPDATQ